jgi:hypothetical protein
LAELSNTFRRGRIGPGTREYFRGKGQRQGLNLRKNQRFARSTCREAYRTKLRGCAERLARGLGQLFRLLQAAVAARHLRDFGGRKNKIAALEGFGHFLGLPFGFGELREEVGLLYGLLEGRFAIGLEFAQHAGVLFEAAMNARFVQTEQV